eukprot:TRINITY_DN6750_c0_g1_i1.p1 TRINITY_DN6750_c0_g1~~TRINITY_DN6750_c0_g1_i1.p1  ORF type:complete len:189 (+),score=49.64 TRINITY_DN6750_c0_g1_i1:392-958(+)
MKVVSSWFDVSTCVLLFLFLLQGDSSVYCKDNNEGFEEHNEFGLEHIDTFFVEDKKWNQFRDPATDHAYYALYGDDLSRPIKVQWEDPRMPDPKPIDTTSTAEDSEAPSSTNKKKEKSPPLFWMSFTLLTSIVFGLVALFLTRIAYIRLFPSNGPKSKNPYKVKKKGWSKSKGGGAGGKNNQPGGRKN